MPVMLRSAEADPHVIGQTNVETGQSRRSVRTPDATPEGEALELPLGRSLRAARPAARHPQASECQGSSSVKQSSRFQGLAPSTSPLCRTTVGSSTTPVPSMGFVPLQGPTSFVPIRPCLAGAGPPTPSRSPTATDPRALPETAANRNPPANNRDPSASSPSPPGRSRAARRRRLAEAKPRSPAFSAWGETPDDAPWRLPWPKPAHRRDSARRVCPKPEVAKSDA
jgi:hypothetical protein